MSSMCEWITQVNCNESVMAYFFPNPEIAETSFDRVVESPRYLYDDPEMELWLQRHCRVWGYNVYGAD